MNDPGWLHYLWNCGLLLLPILGWNLAIARYLPPQFESAVFDHEIPPLVSVGENVLRMIVFVLPFFMPLDLTTAIQRQGLWLFAVGTGVYFLSWMPLIVAPQSAWSVSRAGFLAPAYTPLAWLLGLGLIGNRLYVPVPFTPWGYALLACAFVAMHVTHVNLVYTRAFRRQRLGDAARVDRAAADMLADPFATTRGLDTQPARSRKGDSMSRDR